MSEAKDFRPFVPRVARALGLRLSRTRAPSNARSLIYHALRHAGEVDTHTLRSQIGRAAEAVRPSSQRAYHTATLLFGYAWMIGPDSPAAGEVRHLFRTYYSQAAGENLALWEFLRDDVRDRASSSNRMVREMAADVRGNEATGPADAADAGNPLYPPDVRLRACERLLGKAAAAQLVPVIEYLRELHPPAGDEERVRTWDGLLNSIRVYGKRPEVASALRDGFVRHAHLKEFSGWLLDRAAEANLTAVSGVAQAARGASHADAPAYSRLLKHMAVRFHSDTAATALRELVLDPSRPAGAADLFVAAATELSDQPSPPAALRAVFAAAVETLPRHAGLAVRAEAISGALAKWGQEVTEEEMTRHLTGHGRLELVRLRKCGRRGYDAIERIARDVSRNTPAQIDDRLRAIEAAATVRTPQFRQSAVNLLWDLYRSDPHERVRAAALLGLGERAPKLTDGERERLHVERTAASPGTELRRAFDDPKVSAWMYSITSRPDVPIDSPTDP